MIGPAGEQLSRPVAIARTPVRLWHLPAVAGLPLLLGSVPSAGAADPRQAPGFGVHPPAVYPPLAAPPGAPPPNVDDSADRRFERAMWWLVTLFLLIALLLTGANLLPGPVWAEMPEDRAMLSATRGRVVALVDGERVSLAKGDHVYVGENDTVRVLNGGRGRLVFRGGSAAILCAGSETRIGPLWSNSVRPVSPVGFLEVERGRLLADTASTSGAFAPLSLTVGTNGRTVVNSGEAWYSVDPLAVTVSDGIVRVDGSELQATGQVLNCGDGVPVAPPAGTPSPSDTPTLFPNPSPNPSPTPSPSPTLSPSLPVPTTPGAPPTTGGPGAPPTTGGPVIPPPRTTPPATPSTGGSPTPSDSPSSSSPSPPPTSESPAPADRTPPTVTITDPGATIAQEIDGVACQSQNPLTTTITATITDNVQVASVSGRYVIQADGSSGTLEAIRQGDSYSFRLGPIPYSQSHERGGQVIVTIAASDAAGNQADPQSVVVNLDPCTFVIG
jgi:putative peptide zinc metalloprotease protein